MRLDRLPFAGPVVGSGADDRVFDALLLAGPPLVLAIAVLGRNAVTVTLAVVYLAVFTGYILYRGWRAGRPPGE